MKRVLLRATAVIAAMSFAGVALADGGEGAAVFTGTYVGADVGYGWGDANSEHYGNLLAPYSFTQANASINGFTFGGHIGHNWDIGPNWRFGVEGAFDYSGLKGDDNFSKGDNNELSAKWEASLQAHLGMLVGPKSMLYVTGGWTWLDADSNVTNAPTETVSQTFSGWTLGAGMAWACTDRMTARVQYRYSDYSSEDLVFPVNLYHMETGPTTNEVSVGLSWKL